MKTNLHSDIHTRQETDWSHVWRKLMRLDWKNKASKEKKSTKAERCSCFRFRFLLPYVAWMLSSHILFKYLIHCLCVLTFGEKGHPRIYINCRQRWFPVTFPRPNGCAVDRMHKTPRIPTKHITTLWSPQTHAGDGALLLDGALIIWRLFPAHYRLSLWTWEVRKTPSPNRLLHSLNTFRSFVPNLQLALPCCAHIITLTLFSRGTWGLQ